MLFQTTGDTPHIPVGRKPESNFIEEMDPGLRWGDSSNSISVPIQSIHRPQDSTAINGDVLLPIAVLVSPIRWFVTRHWFMWLEEHTLSAESSQYATCQAPGGVAGTIRA